MKTDLCLCVVVNLAPYGWTPDRVKPSQYQTKVEIIYLRNMALSCIEAPLGTFSSVEIEFFVKSTFTLSQIEIQNYSNPILNLDQNSTSCHLNERGLFP